MLGSARSSLPTTSWIDDLLGRQPVTADGGRAGRLECLHDPFGIDVAAQILDLVRADGGHRRQRVSKAHAGSRADRVTTLLARRATGSAGRRVTAGPPAAFR